MTAEWWSPGGFNRGRLKNVIKLAFNPDEPNRNVLYPAEVNPVVSFPGEGTVLYGDKTMLSEPGPFDRINVRMLFIVLRKAISQMAKTLLFEFNDDFTRATFRAAVNPYLRLIQGQRGIQDGLRVGTGVRATWRPDPESQKSAHISEPRPTSLCGRVSSMPPPL